MRKWIRVIIGVLFVAALLGYLSQAGYLGMWTKGIGNFRGNPDGYTHFAEPARAEYTFTVNLSDLESNVGKTVYDQDGCTITIDQVDNNGIKYGGYRLFLRSHGSFSADRAELVSGIKYGLAEPPDFTADMTATLTCDYNGYTYQCGFQGYGLDFKDGDIVGFYLFPSDAYESGQIPEKNAGEATVTISNLTVNTWSRQ